MKLNYLSLIAICMLFTNCKKEQNPFEIAPHHIGLLTDSTQVKDLKAIFINDSISTSDGNNAFSMSTSNIEIFDKEGNKLLVLTPKVFSDSTSVIKSVQIIDPRYKTDKQISNTSTFKDIANSYAVSRIDNLISSVVVTVSALNANFTIDKKELPSNLRYNMDLKIEETHIPDNAKLKYFFINWNN